MNAIVKREAVEPPVAGPTAVLSVIASAASDPRVDIDKLERLLQMQERMLGRQAEQEFNQAMNRAQADMRRIGADASNPQTRSRYATYAALDRFLRPIYVREGFALSFDTGETPLPDVVRVMCHVSHASGHTRTYHADMPADGKGAKGGDVMTKTHATGSAMQYGMRYLVKMIFNVAVGEDDDDGNGASGYPVDLEAAAKARAAEQDWTEAILAADTAEGLTKLGSGIASAGLAPAAVKRLRDTFAAQKAKLGARS